MSGEPDMSQDDDAFFVIASRTAGSAFAQDDSCMWFREQIVFSKFHDTKRWRAADTTSSTVSWCRPSSGWRW